MIHAMIQEVEIGSALTRSVSVGHALPLVWIVGPCVIEERDTMARAAETIRRLADQLRIPVVFKSSYEKDNRSTELSYQGPGLDAGLELLRWVKKEFELPVLSDVHRESDLPAASEVLDVIQIPAFLCNQTSLLLAAGRTGLPVNVKKGQFLSPEGMQMPVGKLERTGNRRILLTERGASFGYHQLVADMTAIPIMQAHGYPVIFDAGHQIRRYGVPSTDPAGGAPREMIPVLLRAAVAAGANGVFLECHPDPEQARCDAASQYPLSGLPELMRHARDLADLIRSQGHA